MLQIATYIDAYYASYMNHATCMSATCIVQWFAMICYRSMICAHSEIGRNKYFVADGCWDRWIYILSYCILTRNQMSSQSVCRSMQSGIRMVQITELAKSILVDCWLPQVSWLIFDCLKYPGWLPNQQCASSTWHRFSECGQMQLKPCEQSRNADAVIVRLISSRVHDWSVITARLLWSVSNLISSTRIC